MLRACLQSVPAASKDGKRRQSCSAHYFPRESCGPELDSVCNEMTSMSPADTPECCTDVDHTTGLKLGLYAGRCVSLTLTKIQFVLPRRQVRHQNSTVQPYDGIGETAVASGFNLSGNESQGFSASYEQGETWRSSVNVRPAVSASSMGEQHETKRRSPPVTESAMSRHLHASEISARSILVSCGPVSGP